MAGFDTRTQIWNPTAPKLDPKTGEYSTPKLELDQVGKLTFPSDSSTIRISNPSVEREARAAGNVGPMIPDAASLSGSIGAAKEMPTFDRSKFSDALAMKIAAVREQMLGSEKGDLSELKGSFPTFGSKTGEHHHGQHHGHAQKQIPTGEGKLAQENLAEVWSGKGASDWMKRAAERGFRKPGSDGPVEG